MTDKTHGEQIADMPVLGPALMHTAGRTVQRLLGFWVIWQAFGSIEAIAESRVISLSGVYANRADFRRVFGCEVEELWPEQAKAFRRLIVAPESEAG